MQTKQHKFTHLGQAPYRLVGYSYDGIVRDEDGRILSGGHSACDHCGRGIAHVFECVSADGKRFTLGSEHVNQLGDEGLTKAVKARMSEVQREARQAKYQEANRERWEHEAEERKAVAERRLAEYKRVRPILATKPHPNPYFASKGKTMLDYLEYFVGDLDREDMDEVLRLNHRAAMIVIQAGGEV